jgi:hypothetical protein
LCPFFHSNPLIFFSFLAIESSPNQQTYLAGPKKEKKKKRKKKKEKGLSRSKKEFDG